MTSYKIELPHRHIYSEHTAITLPVTLISDINIQVDLSAKLDTGSTYCIFEKKFADWLELDISSGLQTRFVTATGSFYCYGHELTMSVFDMKW